MMLQTFQVLMQDPLILGFFLITLLLGFAGARSSKTFNAYTLADRSMGTGALTLTLIATMYGGHVIYIAPDILYNTGLAGFVLGLGTVCSAIAIGLWWVPKMVYFEHCYTLPDMMGQLSGRRVRIFIGLVSSLGGFLIVLLQFIILGKAVKAMNIPSLGVLEVMVLTGVIVAFYTFYGGIQAVTYTHVWQWLVMIGAMVYMTHTFLLKAGGIEVVLFKRPPQWVWDTAPVRSTDLMYCLYMVLLPAYLIDPGIVQRLLTCRDKRQGRYAFLGKAFFDIFFMLIMMALAGIAVYASTQARHVGDLPQGSLLGHVATAFEEETLPHILLLAILAAIMSSVATYSISIGFTFIYDVVLPLQTYVTHQKADEKMTFLWTRIVTVLCLGASIALACKGYNVHSLIRVYLYLCYMVLIPCLASIAGLKVDEKIFFAGVGGYLVTLLTTMLFLGNPTTTQDPSSEEVLTKIFAALGGLVAFLGAHYMTYGEIIFLERTQASVSEQLWLPERSVVRNTFYAWWGAIANLPETAINRMQRYGSAPFMFSFFLVITYLLPYPAKNIKDAMQARTTLLVLRSLAICFLAGLWAESLWPRAIRRYFALYYYLTLGYCLVFMETLMLLFHVNGIFPWVAWCTMLILLICLTDYKTMWHLLVVGVYLAFIVFRVLTGTWLPPLTAESLYATCYLALVGVPILLVFVRRKQKVMRNQVKIAKALGNNIAHQTKNYLTISQSGGQALEMMLKCSPAQVQKAPDGTLTYALHARVYEQVKLLTDNLEQGGEHTQHKIKLFVDALRHEHFDVEMGHYHINARIAHALRDLFSEEQKVEEAVTVVARNDFVVRCSPPFFNYLVYNLVRNALHHGHADTITIKANAEAHTFEVHDNGHGIPAERVPHIFDLFYTASPTPLDNRPGLGLALVRSIVTSWGAEIDVYTKQGKDSYTSFVITFPPVVS